MNRELLHNAASVAKVLFARLRFLSVFLIAGFLVGYWDDIRNHWDKWTRPPVAPDSLQHVAASDIEYYCAMHPNIIRAEPGNCPICGMPLIKRKKGEKLQLPENVLARVQLSPQRIELAGIGTSAVRQRPLLRKIRTVGVLDYAEPRVAQLSARVGGRADELFIQYAGQQVKKGDKVYSLYSPELYVAQREYLQARKRVNELAGSSGPALQDAIQVYNASVEKLALWGIPQAQLDAMDQEYDRTGRVPSDLVITSPISGVVVRKDIFEGGYVQVGDRPFTIADLSVLWLQLKLYEQDVPLVAVGQRVQVSVESLPGKVFDGTVTFKAFQLDPQTRTLDVRVEVGNAELNLRPGMFADATIAVPVRPPAATQPATRPAPITPQRAKELAAAFKPYLEVQDKLAHDQAEGVAPLLHEVAAALKSFAGDGRLGRIEAAAAAAHGQDLPALRESFKQVSAAMIELGHETGLPEQAPSLKVFHCPMANANWLQRGDATLNPYYGSQMLTCGSAVESLPKAAALVAAGSATLPAGEMMLSIPRSAVIETGRHRIVYVESSPGVYDMRAVELGPDAGEYYPVLKGLSEGERVVTAGAFLVDSENRLNPAQSAEPGAPQSAGQGAEAPSPANTAVHHH